MQAKIDGISEQYNSIRDLLSLNPDAAGQVGQMPHGVNQAVQSTAQSSAQTQAGMAQMLQQMQQLSRPKRRIPVRDPATGDIAEVREVFDDEQPAGPVPMPMGPPSGELPNFQLGMTDGCDVHHRGEERPPGRGGHGHRRHRGA